MLILQYQKAHGFSSVKISHPHKTSESTFQNFQKPRNQYLKIYLNNERNPFGNSGINEIWLISINWLKKLRNQVGSKQATVIFFHFWRRSFIFQRRINSSHKFLYPRFHTNKTDSHLIFRLEFGCLTDFSNFETMHNTIF